MEGAGGDNGEIPDGGMAECEARLDRPAGPGRLGSRIRESVALARGGRPDADGVHRRMGRRTGGGLRAPPHERKDADSRCRPPPDLHGKAYAECLCELRSPAVSGVEGIAGLEAREVLDRFHGEGDVR